MKTYKPLLILLIGLFAACQHKDITKENRIMVTIEPLRYFTEAIVKNHFEVHSMVPVGVSPETYDPTPQQLLALSKSVAYFKIGYIGFELSWMKRLEENTPDLKILDTSQGIDLILSKEQHKHNDHYHGGVEPHTWNSIENAKIISSNILNFMIELDSIHKEEYIQNYNQLIAEIGKTEHQLDSILNDNSQKGFMIYHPALSYFARDYNLKQISIEEEGKEPTPSHLKNLIKQSINNNIHVIFVQQEFDKKNAEIIAKETNSKIVSINPLSYDWHGEMITVANALANN